MAQVRLRLLGGFGLEVDGRERGTAVPARVRSMLAYLALHPGAVLDRGRLAFLFWPESTESQARTNLRNVLHHLRRIGPELDAVLEITPTALRWVGGDGVEVDALAFRAAAEAAPAGDAAALRAAADRYGGDLLEGVDDPWLDDERGRLRDLFLGTLRRLAGALDGPEAVGVARELVRREPLDEDHHRVLIAAHTAAGDRAGAVRAYHECVAVLDAELGVEPSAATRQAYAAALAEVAPPAVTDEPTARAPATLVGRSDEWAAVTSCWAGSGGRAHLVLVTGEAGVGKTRLVEDFAAWCARRGATVVTARAYPTEGELGFGTVIEWLRAPAVGSAVGRLPPADRAELARLLPELGAGPPPGPMDEAARLRTFDAAAAALTGTGRPLLLVADDAHWCDAASLQFVHYLIRTAAAPVLVAATARQEDLDEHHPLVAAVDALRVLDRSTELALGRLDIEATGDLARTLGVTAVDRAGLEHLYRETEGNPLFVVEAVRAGWDGRAEQVDLSPKLQAVIAGRLRQLSAPARELLDVAAVIGRSFTAGLLGRAAGVDDLVLVRGLDELWRRGVFRSHGPDGYDFTHGKLRDAAYAGIGPAARRRHHERVAGALIATAGDPEAASGQVAGHLDRAGRAAEAVDWYRRAAGRALRVGGSEDAVRLLERARTLAASRPEPGGLPLELEVLCALPTALGGVDGYVSDRLTEVQRRAAEVARRLGVELAPPMLRSLVMSSLCRDEFDDAAGAAERLRRAGVAAGDGGLEIEAHYLLGVIAFWAARLPEAEIRFREVIERFDADRAGDHIVRFGHDPGTVCRSRLANTLWFLGRREEAEDARDQALRAAAGVDERVTVHVTHLFGALLSLDVDDHDAFRRCAAGFSGHRVATGVHTQMGEAVRGVLEAVEGDADRGAARIEAVIARLRRPQPRPEQPPHPRPAARRRPGHRRRSDGPARRRRRHLVPRWHPAVGAGGPPPPGRRPRRPRPPLGRRRARPGCRRRHRLRRRRAGRPDRPHPRRPRRADALAGRRRKRSRNGRCGCCGP